MPEFQRRMVVKKILAHVSWDCKYSMLHDLSELRQLVKLPGVDQRNGYSPCGSERCQRFHEFSMCCASSRIRERAWVLYFGHFSTAFNAFSAIICLSCLSGTDPHHEQRLFVLVIQLMGFGKSHGRSFKIPGFVVEPPLHFPEKMALGISFQPFFHACQCPVRAAGLHP